MIYLDNAATSWPKPPGVIEAMSFYSSQVGANPGRSGHRLAAEAARITYAAREAVAGLLGVTDPLRVVFGLNATEALNVCLCGYLRSGDHVITSSVEHNSVMRPLRALEKEGVGVTVVPCSPQGLLDPAGVESAIRSNTVLVALNHASNVMGTLLPVAEVGRLARRHDLALMVDAAQTAGAVPIDMERDCIDLLVFSGHKALYGPMGTGGLVIGETVSPTRIEPLKRGGTGSRSEHEEQPEFLPDRFESGTPNAVGLAGLAAGAGWVREQGVEAIREREVELAQRLIDGLRDIRGVTVHGTLDARRQTGTVSFHIEGMEPSTVGLRLDDEHGILCRVGLHCSPAAHRTIGTFPAGSVRLGLGAFSTADDVRATIEAVRGLAREAGGATG